MPVEIGPFDPSSASKAELAEYYAVSTAVMAVDRPDVSPLTLAEFVEAIKQPRTVLGPIRRWAARDAGRIVGTVSVTQPEHENRHLTIVQVTVLPERWRQGLGTALLRGVLPDVRAEGRTVVMGYGVKADASGEAWARKLGFVRTHGYVKQTLKLADVDPALWQCPVADGFRVESWTGAAPEALLVEYARARTAITDAPTGESTLEFEDWTPERVRTHEADLRTRGVLNRVTVAVHEDSGRVAGLTELEVPEGGRRRAIQQDTAVMADFRGHGLGLAIKGATLRWLTTAHPEVEEILTQTAHDNAPMIRVNHALGYTSTGTAVELEVGVAELAKRLEA
ncbi:mycothiol synthase [Catenulispora sp. GP43]|uniref:GNAT family N-acetyltransferase n=1 Tax=Catenulispora sp. GP43 TaxID=3156263 RepID=UPI0035117E18